MDIGRKVWVIAEGDIPAWSNSQGRAFVRHEAACILHAGSTEAHIDITIYYTNKAPLVHIR